MNTKESIAEHYHANFTRYERLEREAVFILEDAVSRIGVKTDSIEHRIKTLESLNAKCEVRNAAVEAITDIVGLRVIALLRSDLARLDAVIRECFDVEEYDDKFNDKVDSFGYMSAHYLCRMKASYSGPRYDGLVAMQFEVQVRTLCMHVWAAVSHYLDYKNEADIPFALRKELNALSALFYVADSQFEGAYRARQDARTQAVEAAASNTILGERLNLDTLTAYVNEHLPDREESTVRHMSDLLEELAACGIKDVSMLANVLKANLGAVVAYETEIKRPRHFTRVGAVRKCLMEDGKYAAAYQRIKAARKARAGSS